MKSWNKKEAIEVVPSFEIPNEKAEIIWNACREAGLPQDGEGLITLLLALLESGGPSQGVNHEANIEAVINFLSNGANRSLMSSIGKSLGKTILKSAFKKGGSR